MKTELEKCLAGEWYDCHVPVFPELKRKTHCLLMKYNFLPYEGKEEKQVLLCGIENGFPAADALEAVGHAFS